MELNELASPDYWRSLSDDGNLRVTFVIPTGRAAECPNTNMALSADGLYIPELALALEDLARQSDLTLQARSMFDIDVFEDASTAQDPLKDNLIISGSTIVNLVASQLLDNAMAYDTYRTGFVEPYRDPKIASFRDEDQTDPSYNIFDSPTVGVMAAYTNPWHPDRIAILCAGLLAVGTVAALRLLLEYVKGGGEGNNRFNSDVPVKIVEGVEREYRNVRLKPVGRCRPKVDLRNIAGVNIRE